MIYLSLDDIKELAKLAAKQGNPEAVIPILFQWAEQAERVIKE